MPIAAILTILSAAAPLIQNAPEVVEQIKQTISLFTGHPDGQPMTDAQRQAVSDTLDAIQAKVDALDESC